MKRALRLIIPVIILAVLGFGGWQYLKSKSPRQVVMTPEGTEVYIEELSYFDRGEKIYGKVYKPQDSTGKHPVLVYCHGLGGTTYGSRFICRMATEKGYVAYAFDFRGGSAESQSDGDQLKMSYLTEKEDLEYVLRRILKEDFTDPERVYLMGHSQGSLVAALVGSEHRNKVRGLILLAPAFNLPQIGLDLYPRFRNIPDTTFLINMNVGRKYFTDMKEFNPYKWLHRFNGEVLLIHGEDDAIVPVSYADKAAKEFRNVIYKKLPGVGHAFNGNAGEQMMDIVGRFLDDHK